MVVHQSFQVRVGQCIISNAVPKYEQKYSNNQIAVAIQSKPNLHNIPLGQTAATAVHPRGSSPTGSSTFFTALDKDKETVTSCSSGLPPDY